MKKELQIYLIRLWPFFLLVIGLPLLSFVVWLVIPSKQMEILVIDKSVRDNEFQEHAGLFWTFNHLKFKKSSDEFYAVEEDYLGFFPNGEADFGIAKDLKGKTELEIKAIAAKTDLVYLADTYGVYESDFELARRDERSKKIYGGLDYSDIQLIRKAKEEGKVVVAEFNSIASPTTNVIRTEFENLMGVNWTGWIGRYFDEFDTAQNRDIPTWMIREYKHQHGSWDLSGPGLIFIKNSGEIEAFIYKKDYDNKVPLIRTQKVNKHGFSLPEVVPYPDWFDVVMIDRDYQVISYYDINPSNEGLQRLKSMGLPRFFPAAVYRSVGEGGQYYFSGDFSDMPKPLGSAHFFGLPMLWRGLYLVSDYTDRQSFYWNYYYPLISQVLQDTRKRTKGN